MDLKTDQIKIYKTRFIAKQRGNTDNRVYFILKRSPIFRGRISFLQLENTSILYVGELALVLYPSARCQDETLGLPYLSKNKYHG